MRTIGALLGRVAIVGAVLAAPPLVAQDETTAPIPPGAGSIVTYDWNSYCNSAGCDGGSFTDGAWQKVEILPKCYLPSESAPYIAQGYNVAHCIYCPTCPEPRPNGESLVPTAFSKGPACRAGATLFNGTCLFGSGPDPNDNNEQCPANGTNPIHTFTGQKLHRERDYSDPTGGLLQFERFYGSGTHWELTSLGFNWRHSFDREIRVGTATNIVTAELTRPEGNRYYFNVTANGWASGPDVALRLEELYTSGVRTGWRVTTTDDLVETYNASGFLTAIENVDGRRVTLNRFNGRLLSATDERNRKIEFFYAASRLSRIDLPDGTSIAYEYTAGPTLAAVVQPDATPAVLTDNPAERTSTKTRATPPHSRGLSTSAGIGTRRGLTTLSGVPPSAFTARPTD